MSVLISDIAGRLSGERRGEDGAGAGVLRPQPRRPGAPGAEGAGKDPPLLSDVWPPGRGENKALLPEVTPLWPLLPEVTPLWPSVMAATGRDCRGGEQSKLMLEAVGVS